MAKDKADQLLDRLKEMFPQYFGNFVFFRQNHYDKIPTLKSEPDLKPELKPGDRDYSPDGR